MMIRVHKRGFDPVVFDAGSGPEWHLRRWMWTLAEESGRFETFQLLDDDALAVCEFEKEEEN